MDWWKQKKKKARAYDEKQRLVRGRARGALLLEDLIECCDGKSNPIKFYSADQIQEATKKCSHVFSYLFGYHSYSSKNENHQTMLFINKVLGVSYLGTNFYRDVAISSMVSGHKNFLKLVGCCLETEDPAMVYDGVKKHYKLDITKEPWKRRMKIAEDIATALAYLHTAFPRPFVYRNMHVGHILLDEDGVAKLSGFSNCISIPEGETFVKVDKRALIHGFVDHDYLKNGVVSEKTDVFGIGILMQKLLTGEERFRELLWLEEEDVETMSDRKVTRRNFPNWFSKSMEERIMDAIADPEMMEKMGEISEEELCGMKAFLMLSQRCIGLRGEVPKMVEVAKELKKIQRSL